MQDIVVVGFGGHAKSVIDTLERQNQYHIVGFTDVEPRPSYRGYKYLGSDDILSDLYRMGVKCAHIAIGYMGYGELRDKLYSRIKNIGYTLPVVIDPSAVVASDVQVGEGCFIGKNVVINADSQIERMCIINTAAIIEHECNIGEFSHIAVGTVLCGNVVVGNHNLIGAGTTVIQGCDIGNNAIIGAGSIVVKDVPCKSKVFGVVK